MILNRFQLFLISIFILTVYNINAQEAYVLDPQYPVHDLQKELSIIADPEIHLTPDKILKDSTLVMISGSDVPPYLNIGITYWGKLSFIAKDSLLDWTLQFEDKIIGTPAWGKSNGKVDVFAYADSNLLFHQKTGVEYSKKERYIKEHWALNQISLSAVPPNTLVTLIIKAQGNQIGYPAYFNLSARSPSQAFYHEPFQFHRSFNFFMLGLTFIIFLYHLLLFLYVKDKVYLWFSIWSLFCTLTHAMTVGLILGSLTNYRYPVWVLIANGVFYTFWFFGRAFIDSRNKYPILDKIMIGLALFLFIEIVFTALYVAVFNPQTSFTGVGIHYMVLATFTFLSFILSIVLALKKDLFARYFGIGTAIAALFLMPGTFWAAGILKRSLVVIDPFATGMFLQTIIYSFGIAYRRQVLTQRARNQELKAQETFSEIQRIKDLDKVKTRFFANISHEFRTPLSLISGPLNLAKKASKGEGIMVSPKSFDVITNNANRLQTLIDQLLDLSKIESGKVHLNLTQGGLIQFIKSITASFESMSERQNISLNSSYPREIDNGFYDKDKLEKILSNLLTNAFKYTSDGGAVTLTVEHTDSHYTIEISDTGKGMNKEEVKRIFERFYRVEGTEKKGSGIGLALTKEMVDLHHGQISVNSRKNEGTTFKVRLPYTLEFLPKDIAVLTTEPVIEYSETTVNDILSENAITTSTEEPQQSLQDLPVALVVEDNKDLRNYISDILKSHYKILFAVDGMQGERMAVEHIPDIIVSDVMMPRKDGYAMCHDLKVNQKTSHIPIIMLTAKAGQENKLEGLTHGADVYLTKPFNTDELQIRMTNLIETRKKLWEHFKSLDLAVIDDLDVTSIDDKFLQNVASVITSNLDNEHLSVEYLAKQVGFSRAQLHRKLKALTYKSANQLIVEIRLNEAKKMLEKKLGSVSEIAYSVGYSNLSYFTKSFKEKFGKLPSKV